MQHENAKRLLEAVQAFARNDVETVIQYVSDDFVIQVPGSNQLSGEYRGHDAFRGFADKMQEVSGGTFQLTPLDTLGSDDHAAGVYRTRAQRNGKSLDVQIVNLYKVDEDGKFAVAMVHATQFLEWNEFWS